MPTASPLEATMRRYRNRWGFLFALPALVFFAVFTVYPMLNSFYLSLTDWNLMSEPRFIGLENYRTMFSEHQFAQSWWATVYYVVGVVPPIIVFALGLALLLNRPLRLRPFYRAAYFTPVIVSMVVASILWTYVYHPSFGLYTLFAAPLGLVPINWLTDVRYAMPALIIFSWWKGTGYYMVLFLAGLQAIPEEYYEAARIDGAGRWQLFRYITLPLLKPTTLFVLVVCVIGAFQVFTPALLITNGGPAGHTRVLPLYLYESAFLHVRMGYASAVAVFLFAILIVLTLLQLRIFRTEAYT